MEAGSHYLLELYPQLFKLVFLEMKRTFLGLVLLGADDEWPAEGDAAVQHERCGVMRLITLS